MRIKINRFKKLARATLPLFFLFFASTSPFFGQNPPQVHSAKVSLARNNSCPNLRIGYRLTLGRSHLDLGIGMIIRREPKDGVWAYRGRAFPVKPWEFLTIPLSYSFDFLSIKQTIDLSLFTDILLIRTSFNQRTYLPGVNTVDSLTGRPIFYTYYQRSIAPATFGFEQHLGVSMALHFSRHITVLQSAGFGYSYYDNPYVSGFRNNLRFQTELTGPFLQIGLVLSPQFEK